MPDLSTIATWDTDLVKAWGPILIGLVTVFVAFILQVLLMYIQRKQFELQNQHNTKQLALQNSKEERGDILNRLNSFYGPLKEYNRQSKIIYDKFRIVLLEEKDVGGDKDRFSTLKYLLGGNKLEGMSKLLFNQIIELNDKVASLIESNSGVVDKPELEDLLGRLGAHIRIMKLAHEGTLDGDTKNYEDVVFPLAIEGALESATLRLQDRLKELNSIIEGKPGKKKTNFRDFVKAMHFSDLVNGYRQRHLSKSTINYYNKKYGTYEISAFDNEGIFPLYERFLDRIPRGGRILDAGCGVGRDTRYFIEKGFLVISLDTSLEMYRICSEYPHAYCLNIGFEEINFNEQFNGIWCCASLLHLPIEQAKKVIIKFATSLKPGGVLIMTLKIGPGHQNMDGRYFQYYDETSVKQLYKDEPRFELKDGDLWRNRLPHENGSIEVEWLNLILTRKLYSQPNSIVKSGEEHEQQ